MQRTNIIILDSYLSALTVDEITYLREAEILVEGLTPEKLKDFHKKSIAKIKETVKGVGLSPDKIEKAGKAFSKRAKQMFDQGKSPQDASKLLMKSMFTAVGGYVKQAKGHYDEMTDLYEGWEKLLISIAAFILILFINGFLMGLIVGVMGPEVGMMLFIIVAGPMAEEALKSWFIQNGMPWIGTGVVFGFELVMYVMRLTAMGASLPKILLVRVAALGMHFATTFVQRYIANKADLDNEDKYLFAAWAAGCAIHITWNLFGMIYDQDLAAWLK